jgi:hypothetical protein
MSTLEITTVEKGIREVGPKRLEVRVFAGRNSEIGHIRMVSRGTTERITAARRLRSIC